MHQLLDGEVTMGLGRVLAVKFGDLGDALLIGPALAALRERFPGVEIDVLASPSGTASLGLLASHPRVVAFDESIFDRPGDAGRLAGLGALARLGRVLRARRYDAVLLLHHLQTTWGTAKFAGLMLALGVPRRLGLDNGRGWFLTERAPDYGFGVRHEADYWLAVAGLLGADPRPRLAPLDLAADHRGAAETLVGGFARPIVSIHPGTGRYALVRRWPVGNFAAVADHVGGRGGTALLLGGPDDDDLTGQLAVAMRHRPVDLAGRAALPVLAAGTRYRPVDLAGRTPWPVLAAVLERCDAFVGNDSGVMHLAAAVGTPVVAVFGPSNARAWGPYDAGRGAHVVIRCDLACSPCIYVGFGPGRRQGCATRDCLVGLTADPVVAALDSALERAGRSGADPTAMATE